MRTTFVPEEFKAPGKVTLNNDYYLMPITTDDLEEDLKVLLDNADAIVETRGGGNKNEWPYVCTLEEDNNDLAWLQICAKYRQLFSYILRSKKDNSYVGCIYIYPIELFFPQKAKEYDVDFSFWITQLELDNGRYGQISKDLLEWLIKDWPFNKKRIYFRNKLIPKDIQGIIS